MTALRTPAALDQFEDAARMLVHVATSYPPIAERPPWWRPLARRRHRIGWEDDLVAWAEGVEIFAVELADATTVLEHAREWDALRDALDHRV